MGEILRQILDESEFFEKSDENTYIPKYLGLILNSVVVYDVNCVIITEEELLFMNEHFKTHPLTSIHLKNINSILIITEEGIKKIL